MHKLFYLIAILLVVACNSSKDAVTSNPKQLFVEELLEMNSEEIKNLFPNEVITEDVGLFEEGTEERAYTVISPNSPNEIHITWKDKNRTQIEDLRIDSNGKWKSKTNIIIGSSYEELTSMNKKPISFYGFGWDYSGAVLWNDGALEGSNVHVFLAPEKEPNNKFYGDQVVNATPEEIKELDLKVKAILFRP
jgi:hypothetical protein